MRKILLATNANEVKTSAVDFACYIANLTQSPIIGAFLETKNKTAEMLVAVSKEAFESVDTAHPSVETNTFCDICIQNNTRYSVYHLQGSPLQEIIKESLYSDVIITDGNTSFNEYDGWPSKFVKELLENAKCPVIISPFDFEEINEVVFAYDGTESSIFAIKQFIHLFPELKDIKITLLQVLKDENNNITEEEKLKGLLMMYYNAVHYDTLHGDAGMELFKKFLAQKNKILVMGAYGRKKFFNRSTADILLKTLNIPIFIAHY